MAEAKTRKNGAPAKRRKRKPSIPKTLGRPTKYTNGCPVALVEYFSVAANITEGKSVPVLKETFAKMPTITGFAQSIGVSPRTIYNWADQYPEFKEALTWANAIGADMLLQLSLNNVYSPSMAQFTLKVNHGIGTDIDDGVTVRIVLDDLQKDAI
jgi:hypothetical protein